MNIFDLNRDIKTSVQKLVNKDIENISMCDIIELLKQREKLLKARPFKSKNGDT